MIGTLNKIYRFAGKMQGTMNKVILFSVLHSIFDMMSFAALALVFSGLLNGFRTAMIMDGIWHCSGKYAAKNLVQLYLRF